MPDNIVVDKLQTLVHRVVPDIPAAAVTPEACLVDLGIGSLKLVNVLLAIQIEFGFEWSDEVAPEVFRTISSMAQHIVTATT